MMMMMNGQFWTVSFSLRTKVSQTLQSVLCITSNKYLVRVLVVLLHARFSVVSPIPFILAAIFFPGSSLYRKCYRTSQYAVTAILGNISYTQVCYNCQFFPLRWQVMSHNLPPQVTTLHYNWNAFFNTLYTTLGAGEAFSTTVTALCYTNADVSERNKNHRDACSTG